MLTSLALSEITVGLVYSTARLLYTPNAIFPFFREKEKPSRAKASTDGPVPCLDYTVFEKEIKKVASTEKAGNFA